MSPALDLVGSSQRLELRGYQEAAIASVEEAAARGVRRQLGVAGVGAGKTIVFVSLAAKMNVRTLILAHRDELITQAAQKVRLVWSDADIGIVKAERRDYGAQDVIVASVQSCSPAALNRMGHFGLVICDEAHHIFGGGTWDRVLTTLRAGEPDGPLLLGVTATPDRADGKGLDSHFDEIVFNYDMLWLIRNGYLVDVRAIEVQMKNLRLQDVKMSRGDFADGALGEALKAANAPWWIVKAWKAHAVGMKTLVFMPTVSNAEDVAAEFMAGGVRAVSINGTTPVDERRRILRDFHEGRYQVLSNVGIATEGYDEPSIECVVNGAPTKSRGLFVQRVGRGVRLYPGKESCLLLDVTDTSGRIDLCSVASLAGVPRKDMKGKTLTEAVAAREEAEAAKPDVRATTAVLRPDADLVTRDVDLFKSHGVKPGRVAWAKTRKGSFVTSAGKMSVLMEPMGDDRWRVVTVDERGQTAKLLEGVDLGLAQGFADDHVRKNAPKALVDRLAPWRKKPPTEKSLAFAQRLGIGVPDTWTADDVSRAIDARLAEMRLNKARRVK